MCLPTILLMKDVEFRNGNHLAQINIIDFKKDININKLTLIEGRFPNQMQKILKLLLKENNHF